MYNGNCSPRTNVQIVYEKNKQARTVAQLDPRFLSTNFPFALKQCPCGATSAVETCTSDHIVIQPPRTPLLANSLRLREDWLSQ